MADVNLPAGSLPKRNVTGVVVAGIKLDDKATGAADSLQIAQIPRGAVLTRVYGKASAIITNLSIGIEPLEGESTPVADVDRYRVAASSTANATFEANLQLPDPLTNGGVVTISSSAAILLATTGEVLCEYTMDPYVDGSDTGAGDS